MTAAVFTSTYIDPPSGSLVGKMPMGLRQRLGAAVYDFNKLVTEGFSAANAILAVQAKKRHSVNLYQAAQVLNSTQIITDFLTISGP